MKAESLRDRAEATSAREKEEAGQRGRDALSVEVKRANDILLSVGVAGRLLYGQTREMASTHDR